MISLLACSEHQRWQAEKILSGWKGGSDRDNKRKIHNLIRAYSDLEEKDKEKNKDQMKKTLGLN